MPHERVDKTQGSTRGGSKTEHNNKSTIQANQPSGQNEVQKEIIIMKATPININCGFEGQEPKVNKPPVALKKKTNANASIEHKIAITAVKEKF